MKTLRPNAKGFTPSTPQHKPYKPAPQFSPSRLSSSRRSGAITIHRSGDITIHRDEIASAVDYFNENADQKHHVAPPAPPRKRNRKPYRGPRVMGTELFPDNTTATEMGVDVESMNTDTSTFPSITKPFTPVNTAAASSATEIKMPHQSTHSDVPAFASSPVANVPAFTLPPSLTAVVETTPAPIIPVFTFPSSPSAATATAASPIVAPLTPVTPVSPTSPSFATSPQQAFSKTRTYTDGYATIRVIDAKQTVNGVLTETHSETRTYPNDSETTITREKRGNAERWTKRVRMGLFEQTTQKIIERTAGLQQNGNPFAETTEKTAVSPVNYNTAAKSLR